ncbi:hypothetical protein C8R45DRAFT_944249 [Mycena sanguinolenta]|nr:hypothetical protein C8R45DRAFT_944249 [Mycena sanguinolenta]
MVNGNSHQSSEVLWTPIFGAFTVEKQKIRGNCIHRKNKKIQLQWEVGAHWNAITVQVDSSRLESTSEPILESKSLESTWKSIRVAVLTRLDSTQVGCDFDFEMTWSRSHGNTIDDLILQSTCLRGERPPPPASLDHQQRNTICFNTFTSVSAAPLPAVREAADQCFLFLSESLLRRLPSTVICASARHPHGRVIEVLNRMPAPIAQQDADTIRFQHLPNFCRLYATSRALPKRYSALSFPSSAELRISLKCGYNPHPFPNRKSHPSLFPTHQVVGTKRKLAWEEFMTDARFTLQFISTRHMSSCSVRVLHSSVPSDTRFRQDIEEKLDVRAAYNLCR